MLAYVFWHRPGPAVDPADYEARLGAFHAVLAADPPPGYGGSCALALPAAPWLPGDTPAYEDWYLVADWAALGVLDQHAVSGARSAPHDAAAAGAASGTAGVYAPVIGSFEPPRHIHAARPVKPAGAPYPEFHAELADSLPAGACAWQRQLTLGPAGEYLVRSPEPLPGGETLRVVV
jgi:hypothetical protein